MRTFIPVTSKKHAATIAWKAKREGLVTPNFLLVEKGITSELIVSQITHLTMRPNNFTAIGRTFRCTRSSDVGRYVVGNIYHVVRIQAGETYHNTWLSSENGVDARFGTRWLYRDVWMCDFAFEPVELTDEDRVLLLLSGKIK